MMYCSFCQINQLEKDKDVVAQSQAISMLEMLPQLSFAVVNALNSFLNDSKVIALVRGLSVKWSIHCSLFSNNI